MLARHWILQPVYVCTYDGVILDEFVQFHEMKNKSIN